MDLRLTVLQHVPEETPGRIATWALEQGIVVERVRLWMGDPVPALEDVQALAIVGGPMSVHDRAEHPWLADEMALIQQAHEAGVPVLGVCLGAQLIAEALGGSVAAMDGDEIGVFEVQAAPEAREHPLTKGWPETFHALHWHGERFEPPPGALELASSQACDQQAFAVDEHVLALQFHLEMGPTDVEPLAQTVDGELGEGDWIQTVDEMRADPERYILAQDILDGTLEAWMAHA